MNDSQILEMIAKTPDIRAVQICDALDQELVDVSAALRSLVDVGEVVKHAGTGPNGQPAQMYNLSEEFKKSRDGVALLALIGSAAPAEPTAAPAPLQVPTFLPGPDPLVGSKVDRGVACVLAKGSATDDDLRAAMGLVRTSAPSAYLTTAVKAGRLHKHDGVWKAGRAPSIAPSAAPTPAPAPEAKPVAPVEPAAPVPVVTVGAAAVATVPAQPGTLATSLNEPPSAAPVYRCALWSDGILEVRRDGQTVAEMPQAAGESLAAFIGRVFHSAGATA